MNKVSDDLKLGIIEVGFKIIEIFLIEFFKVGGVVKCFIFRVIELIILDSYVSV